MKTLSFSRIAEIAATPGARAVAVENFLGTLDLDEVSLEEARANLASDAKAYGWEPLTVRAIQMGLYEAARV